MTLFTTRRLSTVAALAAVTAAAAASGLVGQPPAQAAPVTKTLNFTCNYPLVDEQPLKVVIKTDIPESIEAGKPVPTIRVDTVSTINDGTTAGLSLIGAASIEGTATSTNIVKAPGGDKTVNVPIKLKKRDAPPSGDFTVEGDGVAPTITLPEAGPGSIVVGDLALHITARDTDGTEITDPDLSDIPCKLNPGQDATLAKFTVTGGDGGPAPEDKEPPTAPGKPTAGEITGESVALSWQASTDNVGVAGYDVFNGSTKLGSFDQAEGVVKSLKPETEYTLTVKARDEAGNVSPASQPLTVKTGKAGAEPPKDPPTPADCGKPKGKDGADWGRCTYISGFSNIKKLDAAMAINDPARITTPVHAHIRVIPPSGGKFGAEIQFAKPLRSEMQSLNFEFMPVRATVEMTQVGDSLMDGTLSSNGDYRVQATTNMRVRVIKATVNGATLPVGPNCTTTTPAKLVLSGGKPEYSNILLGGPLRGYYTIPPFKGCGVGEKIDALLTASISGPGNYVKMRQGKICNRGSAEKPTTCPYAVPER
ncbi:fibronectin type III domain-containing protein [Actinomadura flavalba]|uniref:fibronectin type III domain-containing protein n=1 Tax=Actinomadura flavalba TaxID=1120938 RepID=UPI000366D497|nr:fibronectin type III domain-containing protein [Actinomadura flavalba]